MSAVELNKTKQSCDGPETNAESQTVWEMSFS